MKHCTNHTGNITIDTTKAIIDITNPNFSLAATNDFLLNNVNNIPINKYNTNIFNIIKQPLSYKKLFVSRITLLHNEQRIDLYPELHKWTEDMQFYQFFH